jgi:hypothetical protein
MLRKLLLIAASIAVSITFSITTQPVEAKSCKVVVAEGRGANEAKASARSVKHLTFKTNRWAKKNGYSNVSIGKSATVCSTKGVIDHCVASHRVCA